MIGWRAYLTLARADPFYVMYRPLLACGQLVVSVNVTILSSRLEVNEVVAIPAADACRVVNTHCC
jgi:hypothetical protein